MSILDGRHTDVTYATSASSVTSSVQEFLAPGDTVAGYRIEALAGAGGMGIVYRAHELALNRPVALKLIGPGRARDGRVRRLFVREALASAGIEHPHILPIYRAGEEDGWLYIAMRYVAGPTLRQEIDRLGRMPPGRVGVLVSQVAGALDAAHRGGLVHRDVKPGNVLLGGVDGLDHAYLADFGLTVRAWVGRESMVGRHGWTGTLAYCAPEQIRGDAVDARTDVYGLGCVLFHALTGRLPFASDIEDEVRRAHLSSSPPSVSRLASGVPRGFDDVIRAAMAKRLEDRYSSAAELADAVRALRHDVVLLHDGSDPGPPAVLARELARHGVEAVVAGPDGAGDALLGANGAVFVVGPTGVAGWERTVTAAKRQAEVDRGFGLAVVLAPGGPDPTDARVHRLAGLRFADLRNASSRPGAIDRLARMIQEEPGLAPTVPTGLEICPYRGLDRFEEEHARFYVGREGDVRRALARLRAGSFLAILGSSGSGKSSLLHAGIVHAIRCGELDGGTSWSVVDVTPGAHPLAALASALNAAHGRRHVSWAVSDPRESAWLDDAIGAMLDGPGAPARLVLVVDQCEEVFTLCPDPGEKRTFLEALATTATRPDGRVLVIVAMRADFYDRLTDSPRFANMTVASQILVGPMSAKDLTRVIEEPARRAGLALEPGLARRIMGDVTERPGHLPLLEHLLLELWNRRRGQTLTLEGYAESDGVEGALAQTADAAYERLPEDQRITARRVFLRLVQPGDGTDDTRRRVTMRELADDSGEASAVQRVVDELASARLLTCSTSSISGEAVVEIAHEALIRAWPRLRSWLATDREALRLHHRLAEAADEWQTAGEDEALLYRGSRLDMFDDREIPDLNRLERRFLLASRARREKERRSLRRRIRFAVGALAAVTAAISTLAILATVQRDRANEARDQSESRRIASSATEVLGRDPQLALLLALRADQVAPTAEASVALRQSTFSAVTIQRLYSSRQPLRRVRFSPDGERAAGAGDGESGFTATPPYFGRIPGVYLDAGPLTYMTSALVSDGRDLWTLSQSSSISRPSGVIVKWSLLDLLPHTDHLLNPPGLRPEPIIAAAAAGRIAAADKTGRVFVWSDPRRPPLVVRAHRGIVTGLAFVRAGDTLVTGGDRSLKEWDAATGRLLRSFSSGGAVKEVDVSSDDRFAASVATDGSVRLWRPVGSSRPVTLVRLPTAATSVRFAPGGRLLAAGAADGSVRVWSLPGGRLEAVLRLHSGAVTSLDFGPDGTTLLSGGEEGTAQTSEWAREHPVRAPLLPGDVRPPRGAVTVEENGSRIVVAHPDGGFDEWDVLAGTRVARLSPLGSTVRAAVLSGDRAVVARADGTIVARRLSRPDESVTLTATRGLVVNALALDAGGTLAVASGGGRLTVWDGLDTRTPPRVLGHPDGDLISIAFRPQGGPLVTGAADGTIRRWDPRSGRSWILAREDEGGVSALAFDRSGRWLASSAADGTIRVRDGTGYGVLAVLRGHDGAVNDLAFSPDGELLVSAGDDRARIWRWRDGHVALVQTQLGGQHSARFDPSGRWIASEGVDGTVSRWECRVCGSIDEVRRLARSRAVRELTPDERARYLPRR